MTTQKVSRPVHDLLRCVFQEDSKIDIISTAGIGTSIIAFVLVILLRLRLGLAKCILISTSLTFTGGLICFLSSLPPLAPQLSSDTQYALALSGQIVNGFGGFLGSLTTEISDHWFSDSTRVWVIAVLSLCSSAGFIISGFITPLMVRDAESVYLINTVYFLPSIAVLMLAVFKVSVLCYTRLYFCAIFAWFFRPVLPFGYHILAEKNMRRPTQAEFVK